METKNKMGKGYHPTHAINQVIFFFKDQYEKKKNKHKKHKFSFLTLICKRVKV